MEKGHQEEEDREDVEGTKPKSEPEPEIRSGFGSCKILKLASVSTNICFQAPAAVPLKNGRLQGSELQVPDFQRFYHRYFENGERVNPSQLYSCMSSPVTFVVSRRGYKRWATGAIAPPRDKIFN